MTEVRVGGAGGSVLLPDESLRLACPPWDRRGLVASLALALSRQVRDKLGRRAREVWDPFRGSGTEGPGTRGPETACLTLAGSQKEGQAGVLGYRLGKLRPRKREGRAAAPLPDGLTRTPCLPRVLGRLPRRESFGQVGSCGVWWTDVGGSVGDLDPRSPPPTLVELAGPEVRLGAAPQPRPDSSDSLFRIWVWNLGNLLLNVLLGTPVPTAV